jgi:hypothetical protein
MKKIAGYLLLAWRLNTPELGVGPLHGANLKEQRPWRGAPEHAATAYSSGTRHSLSSRTPDVISLQRGTPTVVGVARRILRTGL